MITPPQWQKSSFSGGGEGNDCVEIANLRAHISIRDSKTPTHGTLSFPSGAFTTFIKALKTDTHHTTSSTP
ncbi:DUF397 domain-containing protein [Streptomyces sp. NBC_00878]|uniref:DUF397 domain-containing protein n=1 Tax=Streptomyces sp. NBC_00878 TaxID=2975854 RepID=UPI00225A465C|nr:DUF397 domain-containing protein [Streptomyces sp. NBC_00878]MCX4907970.1 DUF397 domain-containing protein [Streptomyces sp. NBC_00878]